jgi:hypothetical protein
MAMITHNGQTISIAEYVSQSIIETARKIIEKEQREKAVLDKSDVSVANADLSENTPTSTESEVPKNIEETTPNCGKFFNECSNFVSHSMMLYFYLWPLSLHTCNSTNVQIMSSILDKISHLPVKYTSKTTLGRDS